MRGLTEVSQTLNHCSWSVQAALKYCFFRFRSPIMRMISKLWYLEPTYFETFIYHTVVLFKMAQTDGTWPNTLLRSLSYKAFFYWKNEMQKLPLHARKKNSLILMFVRTFVSNVAYQTSGYQIPVLQASQKECFYCSTTLNSQAAGKYNELIEVV
jgi:hypothetical protein